MGYAQTGVGVDNKHNNLYHRLDRIAETLADILASQKKILVKKWYKILGKLKSTSIAIPGARGLFRHMQHALKIKDKSRIKFSSGSHTVLFDFRWIQKSLASCPMQL